MSEVNEPTGFPLLDAFRALVRREIDAELKRDGYHKRGEGLVRYSVYLPPTVDWTDMPDPLGRQPDMGQEHEIQLYCYVIGPSRLYTWKARTAAEVFRKATADFQSWVDEADRERAEEDGVA